MKLYRYDKETGALSEVEGIRVTKKDAFLRTESGAAMRVIREGAKHVLFEDKKAALEHAEQQLSAKIREAETLIRYCKKRRKKNREWAK